MWRARTPKACGLCLRLARAALLWATLVGCSSLNLQAATAETVSPHPFPAQYRDASVFLTAISHAAKQSLPPRRLSGFTVPHHLLAADLIAQAFEMTDASRIDKVIILFPDHFNKSRLAFATTRRSFETMFGRVDVDQSDVRLLRRSPELVDESDLFGADHGIGAILPFIRRYLPSAKIVPVAVAINARQTDWDALLPSLRRIAGPSTLVVQSTDFSHYLSPHEAAQRDQEVLNILAADDHGAVARLRQPQHTDSRGSQYLQMRLQRDVYGAQPQVLFNSNAHAYADGAADRTTSYIVQLYEPRQESVVGRDLPGSKVYCFAGDTFLGRGMLRALADRNEADRVLRDMKGLLNGCRLIVNLTGVVVAELPVRLERDRLAMPALLTLQWLKSLNVVAVSLANNHTKDLGKGPLDAMANALTEAGIVTLRPGSVADLGPFRLVAFTDLDNWTGRGEGVIASDDLQHLAVSPAKPPLFAVVNWGVDYEARPRSRQLALMDALRAAGCSLIVGVHPHVAATGFDVLGGGDALSVYSLGNFLFDQSSLVASGSLLEVRIFDQGTYFARLVPHANFFERALKRDGR